MIKSKIVKTSLLLIQSSSNHNLIRKVSSKSLSPLTKMYFFIVLNPRVKNSSVGDLYDKKEPYEKYSLYIVCRAFYS